MPEPKLSFAKYFHAEPLRLMVLLITPSVLVTFCAVRDFAAFSLPAALVTPVTAFNLLS